MTLPYRGVYILSCKKFFLVFISEKSWQYSASEVLIL